MGKKAKTNWHLVIWPILISWSIIVLYVLNSDLKSQADTYIPILMTAAFVLIILFNAILGSNEQHKIDLEEIEENENECRICKDSSSKLYLVDYEYVIIKTGYSISGKYCKQCAEQEIKKAFRKTLIGGIACPPVIVYAWFKKKRELKKLEEDDYKW
jgi:hypothetical protein